MLSGENCTHENKCKKEQRQKKNDLMLGSMWK